MQKCLTVYGEKNLILAIVESKRESLVWSGLVWLVEVVRGKVLGKSAHSYSSLPEPSESPSLAIWCQLGLIV